MPLNFIKWIARTLMHVTIEINHKAHYSKTKALKTSRISRQGILKQYIVHTYEHTKEGCDQMPRIWKIRMQSWNQTTNPSTLNLNVRIWVKQSGIFLCFHIFGWMCCSTNHALADFVLFSHFLSFWLHFCARMLLCFRFTPSFCAKTAKKKEFKGKTVI